ncbi:SDR family oxidoreductase (plasmid) [Sulfitobacter faviae]|uniref:SDR family oxidoreductase n=1 Tax=Sulfitobacter faviae TaxID=1775881 RepID=A0ABZ0V409_9RHOB|nr:SDR family oxidoreductase [Sulfitobacter faviae]WPZ23586.1 SDR family oxidoreductase [Sulfitobacter faviae]
MTTLSHLMSLNGRRALITGGAGHIAMTMAETLAELGADLILVDREAGPLNILAARLGEAWGVAVSPLVCDLEDQAARESVIGQVKAEGAGLDILVNNAAFVGTSGLEGWGVPFEEQSLETWRRAMEVNLTAAFHLSQRLCPLLRARGHGSIINIGSIYGELGPDWSLYEGTAMANPAAYAASKGGLFQYTRWLATTLAPDVRVNAISPGGVARDQPECFVEKYVARTPMRRMAVEDDFRGTAAYLASDASAYVTGQVLRVDGGWGIW